MCLGIDIIPKWPYFKLILIPVTGFATVNLMLDFPIGKCKKSGESGKVFVFFMVPVDVDERRRFTGGYEIATG